MGKFTLVKTEVQLEAKRQSEYTELYADLRKLAIGEQVRIGPFTRKEANSVQTSVTGQVKFTNAIIHTFIRDESGQLSADPESCYLFIKVEGKEQTE